MTGEFFRTLGAQAASERVFGEVEDKPGARCVVVLNHRFWQKQFGGDTGIVNQEFILNGMKYRGVGVMPAELDFPKLVARTLARPCFNTLLLALLGLLALTLAAVGIFGIISYTIAQRTHEIGIRIALGAQRRDVLRLVANQGLRLTVLEVAIGLTIVFVTAGVMKSLL